MNKSKCKVIPMNGNNSRNIWDDVGFLEIFDISTPELYPKLRERDKIRNGNGNQVPYKKLIEIFYSILVLICAGNGELEVKFSIWWIGIDERNGWDRFSGWFWRTLKVCVLVGFFDSGVVVHSCG